MVSTHCSLKCSSLDTAKCGNQWLTTCNPSITFSFIQLQLQQKRFQKEIQQIFEEDKSMNVNNPIYTEPGRKAEFLCCYFELKCARK